MAISSPRSVSTISSPFASSSESITNSVPFAIPCSGSDRVVITFSPIAKRPSRQRGAPPQSASRMRRWSSSMPTGPRYCGARIWTWRTGSRSNCSGMRSVAIRTIPSASSSARARRCRKKSWISSPEASERGRSPGGSSERPRRSSNAAPDGTRGRGERSARCPPRSARRRACPGQPGEAGPRRRSGPDGSRARSRRAGGGRSPATASRPRRRSRGRPRSGCLSSRPGISPGIHSSALWMVEAGAPFVATVSLRAARPVGASRRMLQVARVGHPRQRVGEVGLAGARAARDHREARGSAR